VVSTKWSVDIMSATVDAERGILYTLLDNGTLIITSSAYSSFDSSAFFSFEGIGTVDTWLIDKHQLHLAGRTLYVLKNGELRTITIRE
jgi:hypothetical protein